MAKSALFTRPISRVSAATVGVLITAIVMTAGMPVYLPISDANSVVLPIVSFPVTWLLLFLWVCFARRMWRVWSALIVLTAAHAALIAGGLGAI